eukprot:327005-Pyramimonas_sp.AAC.1
MAYPQWLAPSCRTAQAASVTVTKTISPIGPVFFVLRPASAFCLWSRNALLISLAVPTVAVGN